MNKETSQFLNDLRKRPQDKPLSFGELISLRELGYINLKSDVNALELMLIYCQNCNIIRKTIFLLFFLFSKPNFKSQFINFDR